MPSIVRGGSSEASSPPAGACSARAFSRSSNIMPLYFLTCRADGKAIKKFISRGILSFHYKIHVQLADRIKMKGVVSRSLGQFSRSKHQLLTCCKLIRTTFSSGAAPNTLNTGLGLEGEMQRTIACWPTLVVYSSRVALSFLWTHHSSPPAQNESLNVQHWL